MPDYVLQHRLGQGQYGEVWLVIDRALGVPRAVKFVQPSKIKDPSNFYAEPHILKSLSHANIVAVEDAGTHPDGRLYIAMEVLPRGSIEDEMKGGVVPIRRAVALAEDVCRAAEYVHNRGYIHRDIKPANVLIANDGRGKLSDFGLTTRVGTSGLGSAYGYLAHIAPEVLTQHATSNASDIYAIAVTLYRMVNGDALLPNLPTTAAIEAAIIGGAFPRRDVYRPFVPARLRRIINKALSVDPSDRHTSASALRRALEQSPLQCDWDMQVTTNGTTWSSTGGTMLFEANVRIDRQTSRWTFSLKKGSKGKDKRRVEADCASGTTVQSLERHVRVVLSRITANGR